MDCKIDSGLGNLITYELCARKRRTNYMNYVQESEEKGPGYAQERSRLLRIAKSEVNAKTLKSAN